MPNLRNAEKALRQSEKRRVRNKAVRDNIIYLRRKLRHAIEEKNTTASAEAYKKVQVALDRAAGKGVMKSNTVSRLKSRAAKKLKAIA
ncbi:MAG: 30S ribosomal protein S20 [bacterium]|nr:30S ribosomal protein S20 [bacterium]